MRLTLAIVFFSVVNVICSDRALREQTEKCYEKYGISFEATPENLSKLTDDKIEEMKKCTLACYYQRTKTMKEDGSLDKNEIIKLISVNSEHSEEDITKVAETCSKTLGKNDCDTAEMHRECMVQEMEKLQKEISEDSSDPK